MNASKDVNEWIDEVLFEYSLQKNSCSSFKENFAGYYSQELLSSAYYVVVDEIPLPTFLTEINVRFKEFLDLDTHGITYKDTYFIKGDHLTNKALHFHELVHVVQWRLLGAEAFIERYLGELDAYGYDEAPLEKLAYRLQADYEERKVFNVENIVKGNL